MQLMTAALAVTYLVTAPIIAYAIFSRLAWRGRASWVLIGVGFMLLALIPQVITQGIPILIVLLTHIREVMIGGVSSITDLVLGLIKSSFYLMAIYMGLMAGIFQEAFRYLAIRDREPGSAPYIGYGFALVDLAFTIMSLVLPLLIPTSVNPGIEYANVISTIGLVGIAVQPIVSILFHLGSSMVLKTYQALNKGFRGVDSHGISPCLHEFIYLVHGQRGRPRHHQLITNNAPPIHGLLHLRGFIIGVHLHHWF